MSALRNQQSVVANAPRVLLYQNYVMYDRWMSYRRFNSYYQDDVSIWEYEHWESEEEERKYYNKNVLNFLVLKFNRTVDGSFGNHGIILLDANFKNIYYLGDYIHIAHADVSDHHNTFYNRTFPVARVFECRPPHIDCFGITQGGRWCDNSHSGNNGYCNEHQDQANEYEDIDVDRLLTLGELMNLPEFASLHNMPLHLDSFEDDNEDNIESDDEETHPHHTFDDDTDFEYDDDDDFDDRRHGPENTIEDDENNVEEKNVPVSSSSPIDLATEFLENDKDQLQQFLDDTSKFEEKVEIPLESYEQSIALAKEFIRDDKEQGGATGTQIAKFMRVSKRLFDENDRQNGDRKIEQALWLYRVFNTVTGYFYIKTYKKFAMNALNKAKEFKNTLMCLNNSQLVPDFQDQLQTFLDDTSKLYEAYEDKVEEKVSENRYTFHMMTRHQLRLRGE